MDLPSSHPAWGHGLGLGPPVGGRLCCGALLTRLNFPKPLLVANRWGRHPHRTGVSGGGGTWGVSVALLAFCSPSQDPTMI